MKTSPSRESGQSHIAAMCVALPIFLAFVFFLVQVCWVGYQSLSLDHALYQVSWQMDQGELDKMAASGNTGKYVHDAIVDDWTQIDPDDLVIENAQCTVVPKTASQNLASAADNEMLLIERVVQTTTAAHVKATATLRVKLLFPVIGVSEVSLVRAIDKTQQISSRFEVS